MIQACEALGQDWEAAYAPYDEATYQFAVERVTPQDVVLDIGAGDLRLARRLADVVQRVYAVECNAAVLPQPDGREACWPDRLVVITEDAVHWPFPPEVTVAVLLMRHCTRAHFALYVKRLIETTACTRLITNARWHVSVEEMHIRSGAAYDPARVGWYACRCGAVGFTEGDPGAITAEALDEVMEVEQCPQCKT